jgi:hypothetical protein
MDILRDTTSILLTNSLDSSLRGYFSHFLINEDKQVRTKETYLVNSGINNFVLNNVLQDHIADDKIDSAIDGVLSHFEEMSFTWWVNQENYNKKLDAKLRFKKLRKIPDMVAMAIDLDKMEKNFSTPNSLYVENVEEDKLHHLLEIISSALNLRKDTDSYALKYDGVVLAEKRDYYRKYVAWLSGDPAAASTLILDGGIASIYENSVQPYYKRGYGLEGAAVYYPLKEASREGYNVGTILCSVGEIRQWQAMGFNEIMRYSRFVYMANIAPKRTK